MAIRRQMIRRFSSAPGGTLSQLLASKTEQWKHAKDLVVCGNIENGRWTYDEFNNLVCEHAAGLLDAKFRPTDTIVLQMQESQFENVVSFYAAALANMKVWMAGSAGVDVHALLRETEARGAICSEDHIQAYYNAIKELERYPEGEIFRFTDFPHLKMLIQTGRAPVPGFYTYESTFVRDDMTNRLSEIRNGITPESTVASTVDKAGQKLHTHNSIVQAGQKLAQTVGLNFQDRVLVGLPQNTVEGFSFGIIPCITEGSLFVLDQGSHFDAESNIDLVQKEYANVIVATEENLKAMLNSSSSHKIADQVKKVAVIGGESEGLKKSITGVFNGVEKVAFFQ